MTALIIRALCYPTLLSSKILNIIVHLAKSLENWRMV